LGGRTSPNRLSQRSITFNHSEDTLETARLHIDPADYSCRKRQRRLRTLKLISGGSTDHPYRWTQAAV